MIEVKNYTTNTTKNTKLTMANVKHYKVGETYFYLGKTRCQIVGETLKPGGVNADEAIIQIETVQGTAITFLYKLADRYLSEKQVPFLQKWQTKPIPTV